MGAGQSSIDPRYVRIWSNLSTIGSIHTRIQMLETLLAGPEYIQVAKQAGVYVGLLQWIAANKRGEYIEWPRIPTQEEPQSTVAKLPPQKRALDILNESYEVLGIDDSKPLTHDTLKLAYKRAAIIAHPDKGGSSEDFDKITKAYLYIKDILSKLIPKTAQDGSDPRFTAPVTKEAALQARGVMPGGQTNQIVVGQPQTNTTKVAPKKKVEDGPPIALNPKKLDMNVFNKLFEENKLPDPEKDDGYGDWIRSNNIQNVAGLSESSQRTLRAKFNSDVFHKTFEDESKKLANQDSSVSKYRLPSELILNPEFGAELGAGRPDQYTKPPVAGGIGYTDLKFAYGEGSTFSQEVRDVSMEGRPKTLEQAKREYGSAPRTFTGEESAAAKAFEIAKEKAEELRLRRLAARDVDAEQAHVRLQRRLNLQN